MEQHTIALNPRSDKGKGPARRLRREGKLPGVLYGLGKHIPISVDSQPVQKLLLTEGGQNTILNLVGNELNGRHALIKDYQVDPLSRRLVHVDFLEIDVTKKIEVTVKLNFTGRAQGVADGGVLNVVSRNILVKCLPTQIPNHIDVDVTALKIGDSIHLDAITLPEGIDKAGQLDATLVTVVPPTKEEEATAVLAPSAEPEVITEKKAEGEEGAAPAADAKDAGAAKKDEKKK